MTKIEADNIVEKYEAFYRKEITKNGQVMYLYNYIYSDYEAFKNDPLSKELRGLIITKEPQKVWLSIPKFFNLNEIEETKIERLQDLPIKKVQKKLDGTLITPVLIKGEIFVKSKSSFDSTQAKIAQEIVNTSSELSFFILNCFDNNFQPFFELIGKDNKHVVDYQTENQLVLIMVRDEEGHFIDVDKFKYKYTTDNYNMTWDELTKKQMTEEDTEGWVVKYSKEDIVKIKTKEFFELHKLHEVANKYKEILIRTLDDDMDDVLAVGDDKLRKQVNAIGLYLTHWTHFCFNESKKDHKVLVQKYKGHEFFKVIMLSKICDMEEVKKHVKKHMKLSYNKEEKAKKFITGLLD